MALSYCRGARATMSQYSAEHSQLTENITNSEKISSGSANETYIVLLHVGLQHRKTWFSKLCRSILIKSLRVNTYTPAVLMDYRVVCPTTYS